MDNDHLVEPFNQCFIKYYYEAENYPEIIVRFEEHGLRIISIAKDHPFHILGDVEEPPIND